MDEEAIVNSAMAKSSLEEGAEVAEATSALEENILSKGKNAYYYAHASNLGKGGDKKNLGGAPRLLARTESKQGESEKKKRILILNRIWFFNFVLSLLRFLHFLSFSSSVRESAPSLAYEPLKLQGWKTCSSQPF